MSLCKMSSYLFSEFQVKQDRRLTTEVALYKQVNDVGEPANFVCAPLGNIYIRVCVQIHEYITSQHRHLLFVHAASPA